MLKRLIRFFFLCLAWGIVSGMVSVCAQEWQSPDSDTSLGHFPVKLVNDLPNFFITDNIAPLVIGTAGTALDWAFLDKQNSLAASFQSLHVQPLVDFGNFYGEGWVEGFSALGSWSIGAFTDDLRAQEFGRDALEALFLDGVVAVSLKYTVYRERPDGGNNLSFPSGHNITAFCIGPVVQKYWGWGAAVAAYGLGTITTFARVESYEHYLSDCIAGAAIGIIIGTTVTYTPKNVSVGLGPGQLELKLAFN